VTKRPISRSASETLARRTTGTGEWSICRQEAGVYYDHDSRRIGYGSKYGEHSYNQRPVHVESIKDAHDPIVQRTKEGAEEAIGE